MTPDDELLFLALGGSGEIGMNVNLYGTRGKWLMVDCGLTFGGPDYPGIDLILPDLGFIESRLDDLLGIVLTHGHEDHIGALPYLALDLGVPLYATPFTAGLIRGKLEEAGIADRVTLHVVQDQQPFALGPFTIRYVALAHSIPEGNALLIECDHGRIFHTGDWKLDDEAPLGGASTAAELAAIGDEGVLAMVCDSTNVFNPEASGSEADVRIGLDEVIAAATGRVFVTTIGSNVFRLQTLGAVAVDTGRRLCIAGRSLERFTQVAKATGYLRDLPETIDFDTAMSLPAREVMIVATGGQGEPRAALSRIAEGTHPLKIAEGDLVVFSTRQIPGNEAAIARIMNKLAESGCEIVTTGQAFVHVSGHPGRPELAEMYRWIRPRILVPVHGEMRHLSEQARFGLEQGIPAAIRQSNGDVIRLAPGEPRKVGEAPVGRLVLDGDVILSAEGSTMNERRELAQSGQISVAVAIGGDGRLAGKPQLRSQGLPVEEDRELFAEQAAAAVEEAVSACREGESALREAIRQAVERFVIRFCGKKPIVDVLIVGA